MNHLLARGILLFFLLIAKVNSKEIDSILTEIEYKMAIEILTHTSQHEKLILNAFHIHVLPRLKEKKSFLDVGAGSGKMTYQIAPYFESADAVEKNSELKSLFQNKKVRLFPCSWSCFEEKLTYDFVLCSHVLYHLPKEECKVFIQKLLRHTNPKGVCMIALMAPRGQNHNLHAFFNPQYAHSGQIKEILDELELTYETVQAKNTFRAASYNQMEALCRFLILEDCLTKQQRKALDESSFESHLSNLVKALEQEDGRYQLEQDEDYFVIRKE